MSSNRTYFAGQLVRVQIDGINKTCVRPAVITKVAATGIEVVYGQGQHWNGCGCPVLVGLNTLLGRRLVLTKDTHFCDMHVVPPSYVRHVHADVCPASMMMRIEAVAVEARRRLAQSVRPARTSPGARPVSPPTTSGSNAGPEHQESDRSASARESESPKPD